MSNALRIVILLLALAVSATQAAAIPVQDVTARYADGVINVAATITSPPDAKGCTAAVAGDWYRIDRIPGGVREAQRGPVRATAAGLVTKTGQDGAVAADVCAGMGSRPMWTEGVAHLQFRPGDLRPGAYRVCITAAPRSGSGAGGTHRRCTGFRVP